MDVCSRMNPRLWSAIKIIYILCCSLLHWKGCRTWVTQCNSSFIGRWISIDVIHTYTYRNVKKNRRLFNTTLALSKGLSYEQLNTGSWRQSGTIKSLNFLHITGYLISFSYPAWSAKRVFVWCTNSGKVQKKPAAKTPSGGEFTTSFSSLFRILSTFCALKTCA